MIARIQSMRESVKIPNTQFGGVVSVPLSETDTSNDKYCHWNKILLYVNQLIKFEIIKQQSLLATEYFVKPLNNCLNICIRHDCETELNLVTPIAEIQLLDDYFDEGFSRCRHLNASPNSTWFYFHANFSAELAFLLLISLVLSKRFLSWFFRVCKKKTGNKNTF